MQRCAQRLGKGGACLNVVPAQESVNAASGSRGGRSAARTPDSCSLLCARQMERQSSPRALRRRQICRADWNWKARARLMSWILCSVGCLSGWSRMGGNAALSKGRACRACVGGILLLCVSPMMVAPGGCRIEWRPLQFPRAAFG